MNYILNLRVCQEILFSTEISFSWFLKNARIPQTFRMVFPFLIGIAVLLKLSDKSLILLIAFIGLEGRKGSYASIAISIHFRFIHCKSK